MKKQLHSLAKAGTAFLLAAVMCLLLAACGSSDDPAPTPAADPNPPADTNAPENNAPEEEPQAIVYNNVEINLETVASGDDYSALQAIVEEFNTQYNGQIYINMIGTPEDSYATSVAQKIRNNINAPDLLMTHQKLNEPFHKLNMIQPLNAAYTAAGIELDTGIYASKLVELGTLGTSEQWGIPIDAQGEIVLYNKVLLDELGAQVPTTYQELLDVCALAKDKWGDQEGFSALAIGTNSPFFNKYVWPTALLQNGVELFSTSDYTASWTQGSNKDGVKNAAMVLDSFFANDYSEYGQGGGYANQQFQQGKALFNFNVPFSVPGIIMAYASEHNITEDEAKEQVGAASIAGLLAVDPGATGAGTIYGDSHFFMLSSTATDVTKQAACAVFIDWFTRNTAGGAVWAEAGHVSTSNVVSTSVDYTGNTFVNDYINKFYPDMNNFTTIGNNPYFSDYDTVLNALCGDLLMERGAYADEALFNERLSARESEINGIVAFSY